MTAARRTTLAMAALLLLAALADPSGLFAPVGWTGHPVAAAWWWTPYAVFVPVALWATHAGSRAALMGPSLRWPQRLWRLWSVTALAAGAAATAAGLALLLPLAWQGRYVLPASSTFAVVAWSSGYAAFKLVLLGWLPALAGASARPARAPGPSFSDGGEQAALRAWVAGGTLLVLALLGPWLAAHLWHGSPMGYVYGQDGPLLSPTPDAGLFRAPLALALVGLALWWTIAGRPRDGGSVAGDAACAGIAAAGLLWTVQAADWALHKQAPAFESWGAPALFVRALDALAFALLCAAIAVALSALVGRIARVVRLGRPRAGLVLAALAVLLVHLEASHHEPAALLTAAVRDGDAPAPPPAASGAMPRLRVANSAAGPVLADDRGARVTLRGVNVNQLGEYAPRDPNLPTVLPLTEQDFADVAALGMNVVRLTLSWSQLEPAPGQVSPAYLARIRTALGWARAHGVYVLLDMHQDGWGPQVGAPPGTACRPGASPMIGWDGAPAWATLTDGTDACQVTGRDMAPNVSRAFQSFYVDRDGIQGRLVHDWGVLAQAFGADATVAGYDLLNEPNFAESPPVASTLLLANYYARALSAIRAGERGTAGGFTHPVFIEPSIFWSGFGIDNLPPRDFTGDAQVVFSPHLYNQSITSDQDFGLAFVSIERGVALAQAAARQLDMPLWVGEWGFFGSSQHNTPGLQRQLRAEDEALLGSAYWVWKQGCSDPHVYPGAVAGNLRQWRCPGMQEIGTDRTLSVPLGRPMLLRSPDSTPTLRRGQDGVSVSGHWSTPATGCDLALWMPGDRAPQGVAGTGATLTGMTRIAPGQASLGPSGGWIVHACLAGGAYAVRWR